jgi:hypothetical protein
MLLLGYGYPMKNLSDTSQRLNLREQVESLLPEWRSWYPSLFHAAEDLGLIRARVCAPATLMLSHRHAAVQSEALQAFKEKWSVEDEPELPAPLPRLIRRGLAKVATPKQQRSGPNPRGRPNSNFKRSR